MTDRAFVYVALACAIALWGICFAIGAAMKGLWFQ
jgi:hypothetical protein